MRLTNFDIPPTIPPTISKIGEKICQTKTEQDQEVDQQDLETEEVKVKEELVE
jgi:hypothetical protein